MIDKQTVNELVEQWLEGKDYFLTDLTVTPDDFITVEIDHADGVWIDDCVQLSRFIEEHLDRDVEDYETDAQHVVIAVRQKVQVEGKKRPVMQDVDLTLAMGDVKSGRYIIDFK